MSIEFQLKIVAVCVMLVLMYIGYPLSNWLIRKFRKREGQIFENIMLAAIFASAVVVVAVYAYDFFYPMSV